MLAKRRALLSAAIAASAFEILPRVGAAEAVDLQRRSGKAPPINLLHPDGTPFSLTSLRGKVVLINFWATWCEPCIAEMPSLQRLRADLGSERFEVLGVNHKEGPARIEAFLRTTGVGFPIVRDTDGAVATAWGARVFPSSFVVDADGNLQYAILGEAEWTSPNLVSKIRGLLGTSPGR